MPRKRVGEAPYTLISTQLFEWRPWAALSYAARALWLGLYASPQARLLAPGLWRGSIAVMADSACMGIADAHAALEELLERRLLVFDQERAFGVFCELPDRAMRPANGKCIVRYWYTWRELPECALTLAWVHLFRWLCEPMTGDHQKHWDSTFGDATNVTSATCPAYPVSVTGQTIGPFQEFLPNILVQQHNSKQYSAERGISSTKETVSHTVSDTVCCKNNSENFSVMKTDPSDTVSDTVCDTPIVLLSPIGSEIGGSGGRTQGPPRGPGNGKATGPPERPPGRPPKAKRPWGIRELFAALEETCEGRVATEPWDKRLARSLWAVVDSCIDADVGIDDIRLAGEWLADGGLGYRDDLGIPWLAKKGVLLDVVAHARAWDRQGRPTVERKRRGGGVTAEQLARRAEALEGEGL